MSVLLSLLVRGSFYRFDLNVSQSWVSLTWIGAALCQLSNMVSQKVSIFLLSGECVSSKNASLDSINEWWPL